MSVRVTRFILLAFFTVGFWLTLTAFFSPTLYSPASLSHYLENGAWGDSVTIDAEQVEKIRELAQKFGGLYPMRWVESEGWANGSYSRPARVMNQPALDRLLACAETQTCGPGEEKVVILASHHFGESNVIPHCNATDDQDSPRPNKSVERISGASYCLVEKKNSR